MNEKEFQRAIRNPRHIPGIFNYCDRWCERCPLTLRCSVYAVEGELDPERHHHDREKATLWRRLEAAAPLVDELLARHPDHAGVGVVEDPVFQKHGRRLDSHRVGAAVKRYGEFARGFIRANGGVIGGIPPAPDVHAVSAAEAFEVIGTYHLLLMVKLSRALSWDEMDEELASDPDMRDMPRDQDGSAKLAMILMERSMQAWAVLSLQVPAHRDAALSAISTLRRLGVAVEKEFPQAKAFVRPGFDTVTFREGQGLDEERGV